MCILVQVSFKITATGFASRNLADNKAVKYSVLAFPPGTLPLRITPCRLPQPPKGALHRPPHAQLAVRRSALTCSSRSAAVPTSVAGALAARSVPPKALCQHTARQDGRPKAHMHGRRAGSRTQPRSRQVKC